MTLKKRIAINIAIAFSFLFGLAACIIYFSFSSFRKEEFKGRLTRKALTTAKLLLEVKEIDKQLLKVIDQNSINKLYDEKILVFDDNFNAIYSSFGESVIDWTIADLQYLTTHKSFYREQSGKDIVGIFYDYEQTHYYILITAEDTSGKSNLRFLFISLLLTFLTSVLLVWVLAYFFTKKLLKPLDVFQAQITNISANHLDIQLQETNHNDEINLLTKAFNQMLLRIDNAFESQRNFAANASHEIRTPLTRIAFQTETLLQNSTLLPPTLAYLRNINQDIHHLSDLVNSLLLLAQFSKQELHNKFIKERIDEIIFNAYQQIKNTEPAFDLDFEIVDNAKDDNFLEVYCVKSLLEIAFKNLLKNAYLYTDKKRIKLRIEQIDHSKLKILIQNEGLLITPKEQTQLFQPFFRGTNSTNIQGSGLGLRIAKRILDYHQADIIYQAILPNINQFEITFYYS